MNFPARSGFGFAVLFLFGCGSETKTAPGGKSAQAEAGPSVALASGKSSPDSETTPPETLENLDFLNWKKFKVGTKVVRRKSTQNAQDWVKETQTIRLKEIQQDKVILESQITVERADSSKKVNPPFEIQFYASIVVPKGMNKDQFNKPSLKAAEVGKEKVTILGKEYLAQLWTWEDQTESGPMPQKLWQSDEVPGRFLKQESAVKRNGISSAEELIEIQIP